MKLSEKIKQIRESENLSRLQFADKYGLKQNTVRFIEENKQSIPDDLALNLEKDYSIPFKWWKTGEGHTDLDNAQRYTEEYVKREAELSGLTYEQFLLWIEYTANPKGFEDRFLIYEAIKGDKYAQARVKGIIAGLEYKKD